MAKATFKLPNGTVINIDGSPEEIHKLLQMYEGKSSQRTDFIQPPAIDKIKTPKKKQSEDTSDYLTEIVNLIKECNEAEGIEKNIIDRISQVDRVLLPLYIIHEYMDNSIALQSGEINKITKELGIPISQPNTSKALSGTAARYVMGDKVRKAKHAVKYKLNRRGTKYLKGVIQGKQDD
jgi:hypothetical protein